MSPKTTPSAPSARTVRPACAMTSRSSSPSSRIGDAVRRAWQCRCRRQVAELVGGLVEASVQRRGQDSVPVPVPWLPFPFPFALWLPLPSRFPLPLGFPLPLPLYRAGGSLWAASWSVGRRSDPLMPTPRRRDHTAAGRGASAGEAR